MTTSYYNLVLGVRALFKPFGFLVNVNRIAVYCGCFLKFISVMYSERERIERSKWLRGVKFEDMKFVDRIDSLLNEIVIIFKFSFIKVDKFKNNLYLNKFGVDNLKYNYRLNKWGKTDTILLIMNVLLLFVVFVY